MPDITFRVAQWQDKPVLSRMLELYQYASSDVWPQTLMGQFLVMKRYRRLGVGTQAARFIFDQFRGKWEVGQMPLNLPAQAFWRRTIADYTQGRYVEHELHDERWDGFLQCFDNRVEGDAV